MQNGALKTLIKSRAILRNERERKQGQLLDENDLYCEAIKAKVRGLLESNQFANFCKCGVARIFKTCSDCRNVTQFEYACSLKWCPRCQWKITERRRQLLAHWVKRITQPKHLVLTQKNFPILTQSRIRQHQKNLSKIRRLKCWKAVKGGCVSIEITNEGTGWHLHSHWLIDARWLDIKTISEEWGRLCGQEFAIVKIMDCRDTEYLQEVTKYVVEGSEMAKWPPEHIAEFVTAIRGRRFFFAFGSLFKLGKEIRLEIKAERKPGEPCECGCKDFIFESEEQAALNEIKKLKGYRQ